MCDFERGRLVEIAPARHNDQVGVPQQFQSAVHSNAQAAGGRERKRVGGGNGEAIRHEIELGPRQREELGGDAELEHRQPVTGDGDG